MNNKLFLAETRKNIKTTIVNLLNSNQLMNHNVVNSLMAGETVVKVF